MLFTKTVNLALVSLASMQAFAAPMAEGQSSAHQLVARDDSVFSSAFDVDFCYWSSGGLFVGWSVIMRQFQNRPLDEMYSIIKDHLHGNHACNSFSWFQTGGQGIGADNTTAVVTFNTDDFCTASKVSKILGDVAQRYDFSCSNNPDQDGIDPDPSNLIVETLGEGADEDPAEARKMKRSISLPAKPAQFKASLTSGTTAHPSGLANMRDAADFNGTHIRSVAEMAASVGMSANATRAQVIEKLNDVAAAGN